MKYTVYGAEVTLEYTEPSTNTDGSALDDLHHTSIFYDIGTGAVNVIDLPASLMTGGGVKSYTFTIPVLKGEMKSVSIFATASDTSGETSDPSEPIITVIDRRVPSPPF